MRPSVPDRTSIQRARSSAYTILYTTQLELERRVRFGCISQQQQSWSSIHTAASIEPQRFRCTLYTTSTSTLGLCIYSMILPTAFEARSERSCRVELLRFAACLAFILGSVGWVSRVYVHGLCRTLGVLGVLDVLESMIKWKCSDEVHTNAHPTELLLVCSSRAKRLAMWEARNLTSVRCVQPSRLVRLRRANITRRTVGPSTRHVVPTSAKTPFTHIAHTQYFQISHASDTKTVLVQHLRTRIAQCFQHATDQGFLFGKTD